MKNKLPTWAKMILAALLGSSITLTALYHKVFKPMAKSWISAIATGGTASSKKKK